MTLLTPATQTCSPGRSDFTGEHSDRRYCIKQPQLWAPQDYDRVLAVLIPHEHRCIPSQGAYLTLLKGRLEWLIKQRQREPSQTVKKIHEILRQSLLLLNPLTPTQPMLPPDDAESYRAWRRAWATAIVEESGAVHRLLALTEADFPQAVASVGRRVTLLQLFKTPTFYSLKDWLGELVYLQTRQ